MGMLKKPHNNNGESSTGMCTNCLSRHCAVVPYLAVEAVVWRLAVLPPVPDDVPTLGRHQVLDEPSVLQGLHARISAAGA